MFENVFEWDHKKCALNKEKHGISFEEATKAFFDPQRVLAEDAAHSQDENRCFCFGKVNEKVMTVRFTQRKGAIRIFGAGYWREGKYIYEKKDSHTK